MLSKYSKTLNQSGSEGASEGPAEDYAPIQDGGGKKKKGSKKSKKSSKKGSKKSSKKGSKKMTGGGKKKGSKKSSKKGSKKASKKGSKKMTGGAKKKRSTKSKKLSGGANAGFEAFLELKSKIAKDLGIPNSPAAGKVAGAVQKEIKEKNMGSDGKPTISSVEVSKKAYDLFKSNMEKYKKIL